MDCQTARELSVAGLAGESGTFAEVEAHLASCRACDEEVRGLTALWAVLGDLPPMEPPLETARKLRRRLRIEAARSALASLSHWQRAALVGVGAFAMSVLLSLAVPYHTMVAACGGMVAALLPAPGAYLVAGLLYGLVPLAVGSGLQGRLAGPQRWSSALEATLIFLAALTPYVVLRCAEFPQSLLAGFLGGITLGALGGGLAGTWLAGRLVPWEVST